MHACQAGRWRAHTRAAIPTPRTTTTARISDGPEIVREKKLGRLTEKIEERLGYCDACERCDVKWTRFRKHL